MNVVISVASVFFERIALSLPVTFYSKAVNYFIVRGMLYSTRESLPSICPGIHGGLLNNTLKASTFMA
jgi:hypothetical protein